MKVKEIKKFVRNTLETNKITIKETYDMDDSTYFLCDAVILALNHKKKELNICFHVTMKPEASSLISLLLTSINYVMIINSSFIYDKDGRVIDGNEAEELFKEKITKRIIGDFIHEQNQLQILNWLTPENSSIN